MVILLLGLLFVAFLIYGALLMSRLRAEDPSEWPETDLPEADAAFRRHPGWTLTDPATTIFQTGIPGGAFSVEVLPRAAGLDREARLRLRLSRDRVTLDEVVPEAFLAGSAAGVRVGSAGSDPDGSRGWFEFHLVEGPGADVVFRYRCPVLSGSRETLPFSRSVESLRFRPSSGLSGGDETSRTLAQ
jgi:hypothetical protein